MKDNYSSQPTTELEGTCVLCGKGFFTLDRTKWVYKKVRKVPKELLGKNKSMKTLYFCSWGCMRKFEKMYPQQRGKSWNRM